MYLISLVKLQARPIQSPFRLAVEAIAEEAVVAAAVVLALVLAPVLVVLVPARVAEGKLD